eukprot:759823-Hanusia_phi.AAC.2
MLCKNSALVALFILSLSSESNTEFLSELSLSSHGDSAVKSAASINSPAKVSIKHDEQIFFSPERTEKNSKVEQYRLQAVLSDTPADFSWRTPLTDATKSSARHVETFSQKLRQAYNENLNMRNEILGLRNVLEQQSQSLSKFKNAMENAVDGGMGDEKLE